jgi:hypothetical protein
MLAAPHPFWGVNFSLSSPFSSVRERLRSWFGSLLSVQLKIRDCARISFDRQEQMTTGLDVGPLLRG